MKPLVTLAVTTLNRPKYLPEILASVLAQDYANIDILVSDNGSNDETSVVTQELVNADPRVRLRRNETTVPAHEHFTQCVRAARGEYFVLLNDDDRINTGFVSDLVRVATRHPDVNAVVPSNVLINEVGATVREFAKPDWEIYDGPTFVCDWLESRDPQILSNPTTVLMRTDVIRRFGGYQRLRGNGRNIDNLLFLQCAITGRVGFGREATFYCRKHPESCGSRSTSREIIQSGRAYMRHLRQDHETVRALAAVSPSCRKRILRGVREMTTFELLNQLNLDQDAFRWRTVRTFLMSGRRDLIFFYIVLREYLRRASPTLYYGLRGIIRPRSGARSVSS
ncbi:glycosyltransferase family 2 protein [Bradyrhizobium sp. DASA03007]|uniref:glycosyltransferase family 2 protein n=1 Tax=unclassified Bradyrhizobium TaxID=2631580 RepID=UPI003F6ED4DA